MLSGIGALLCSFNYLFHYFLKSPTRGEDDKSLSVMFFYYFISFCFKNTAHTGTQFNWNYFECEDSLSSLRGFILTVDIVISREPLREI